MGAGGLQIGDKDTSSLTLTSAFLLRRLLAAAERQNDTPSDGRVHIIHLGMTTGALNLLTRRRVHALAAKSPAHRKRLETSNTDMQNYKTER